jgi:hypothetical protein
LALSLPFRRETQEYVFRHLSHRRLKAAREKRDDAERLLDQALDPVAVRGANRQEDAKLKHTFRAVGEEWAKAKLEKENCLVRHWLF